MSEIQYPFIPDGRTIAYVSLEDPFMRRAREVALTRSQDHIQPDGVVIVLGGVILGEGANGSDYHEKHGCERKRLGIPTGQQYELCEGCSPKNHGEPSAIGDAIAKGRAVAGADLYLWGHWWCCEPCWNAMEGAGIAHVFLLEGSEYLFNRDDPRNIIGKDQVAVQS